MATNLEDDFNRSDSSTVGGGWTETQVGSGTNAEILSNQLKITTGNSETYIYQDQGTPTDTILISVEWTPTSTYGQSWVTVLNDGTQRDGYGLYLYPFGSTITIVDNQTSKATDSSFTLTTGGSVTYRIDLEINGDSHIDAYVWDDTGSRPVSPDLSWTNSGSPYTPTASGNNALIESAGQGAGGATHYWDNYSITDIVVATNAVKSINGLSNV